MKNIAIGTDHRGFLHKEYIKRSVTSVVWMDVGAYDDQRSDYPVFAREVCDKITSGACEGGVLLCGSGIGIAIAANRQKGIYAGLVWNQEVARLARAHDNINVLVLPADFVNHEQSAELVRIWLATSFLGGRYAQRLSLIDNAP